MLRKYEIAVVTAGSRGNLDAALLELNLLAWDTWQ
jgi:hypothetical protein